MTILDQLFSSLTLVPVVVINDADDAVPLAESLLEGGISSIEITMRTDAALSAIKQVATHVPDIVTGVGTVTTRQQMQQAADAGAAFQVSPGITASIAQYAQHHDIVWLPGVTDASQIMTALEHNITRLKFFPAGLSGGVPMLKQFSLVFPALQFCPTGGIDLNNMRDYATLPNICAIGGSWLTPKDAIIAKDWPRITRICRDSLSQLTQVG